MTPAKDAYQVGAGKLNHPVKGRINNTIKAKTGKSYDLSRHEPAPAFDDGQQDDEYQQFSARQSSIGRVGAGLSGANQQKENPYAS